MSCLDEFWDTYADANEDMVKENDNMYAYDIFNTRIKLENHHLPSQPAGGLAIGLQIDTSGHSMDICRNLLTMAQQRAEDISRVSKSHSLSSAFAV